MKMTDKEKSDKHPPVQHPEPRKGLIARVRGVLPFGKQPDQTIPVDIDEIMESFGLEKQYNDVTETLLSSIVTPFPRMIQALPPSFKEVVDSFDPEDFRIIEHYQKPVLLLVPESSVGVKIAIINNMPPALLRVVGHSCEPDVQDLSKEKITGWRAKIVDGAQNMKWYEGDDPHSYFGHRVELRKKNRRPGEKGMDKHTYLTLLMQSTKAGEPVDTKVDTILDDEELTNRRIPIAHNLCGVMNFKFSPDSSRDSAVAFRSSVGGSKVFD